MAVGAPAGQRCYNHPEREGVGVCVQCRRVICVECGTRIDGMNYCTACLNAGWEPLSEAPAAGPASALWGVLMTGVSFVILTGLFAAAGLLAATYLR